MPTASAIIQGRASGRSRCASCCQRARSRSRSVDDETYRAPTPIDVPARRTCHEAAYGRNSRQEKGRPLRGRLFDWLQVRNTRFCDWLKEPICITAWP